MMADEIERWHNEEGWAVLPDVLLEEAFSFLSLRYLGRCSQVCANWYRVFRGSRAWQVMIE